MQSKGWIRLVAILLAIASIWQLSFTAVTSIQEKKAAKFAEKAAVAAQNSAAFAQVPENDQAYYLDSIRKEQNRVFIDSISSKKVFLWNTYKECKAKEINLGLDLKGGMNVMLQVQLQDLVKAISGNSMNPEFQKALALAKERSVNSREDYITLFADAWKEVSNGQHLAQIFGTYEMKDKITPASSDADVISVIRDEAESAVANSFNVLRSRIDRFGVTQPSIQKLGNSGRILVELPGVKEPERVRKLLQGTASLEFWETYTSQELSGYLAEANAKLAEILAGEADTTAVVEPAAENVAKEGVDSLLNSEIAQNQDNSAEIDAYRKANPLFAVLSPSGSNNACIGFAAAIDTAKVNRYLAMPQIAEIFPAEFKPMWSVKPSEYAQGENIFELVAIKATSRDGKAKLDGGVITDARVVYDHGSNGEPSVSMSMNAEGANVWARMTSDNVGKQIAIVLDDMVYSYPNVQNAITGGSSSITGHFTPDEATDLVNVLKSGKLPAPATIIQEQVVGPSLGAKSINAGMISFIIAFLLVLVYMISSIRAPVSPLTSHSFATCFSSSESSFHSELS